MMPERRTIGEVDLLVLRGPLDAAAAPGARAALQSLIAGGRVQLALDLGNVSFVDSTGLSVLVTALKGARRRGGDLVLVRPTAEGRMLLELTRLHEVFRIVDAEETALESFAA